MNRQTARWLPLVLLPIALISGRAYGQGVVTQIPGIQTFQYKTATSRPLSLYLLQPSHAASETHPAIVFFFGGGWAQGTTDQFADEAQHFASRGFAAVLVDYRVTSKDNSSPFESVRDARSSIRWLRVHAKEFHIDANRIVASGGSAGGHLAGATALLPDINDPSDDLKISASPAALVLFNPALDTTKLGSVLKLDERRLKELSLTHHLSHSLPPTIIFHGTSDHLVPFATAVEFTRIAKTYGADCELVSFPGEDHGFFNSPQFKKNVTPGIYQKVLDEVDSFLKRHRLEQP